MGNAPDRRLAGALVLGVAGGLAAAIVWVSPAWAGFSTAATIAEGMAFLIVALTVRAALRAAEAVPGGAGFTARVSSALVAAAVAAAIVVGALYALYRWLAPGLLAERYEAYVAHVAASHRAPDVIATEVARLARLREGYLDPLGAAVHAGLMLFLGGMLVATFLVWQRRARATARGIGA